MRRSDTGKSRTARRSPGFGGPTSALAFALILVLWGCGSGAVSLTEYVDQLNAMEARANPQATALQAQAGRISDFTPQDLAAMLRQARVIRLEIKEAADPIEPPSEVAGLHELIFGWHDRFIGVEDALAARADAAADTEADWEALSNSPEMTAYRKAIAEGKQVCIDFQAELDSTAARGAFADMAWMPSRLSEVVEAVLGCEWFPADPSNVFAYP